MHNLSNIGPRRGARKKSKRVGRGAASGLGKTSGKGNKGQLARTGASVPARFEGGQMPIHRKLPKRGFTNAFRTAFVAVNIGDLAAVAKNGDVVDGPWLEERGLVPKNKGAGIKLLGDGEIKVAITVRVARVSGTARTKVESAGGTVELV